MVTTEAERIRAAHRAFTRGRLRLAAYGVVATLALMVGAMLLGSDRKSIAFGACLMVIAAACLYVGRESGRAVLPAFLFGLIPFSAVVLTQAVLGHGCHTGGCASVCLPACVVSGAAAGALLAALAVRTRAKPAFIVAAASMTWLVGALGCPCVGVSSVAGMAAGIAVPATWALIRLKRNGAESR